MGALFGEYFKKKRLEMWKNLEAILFGKRIGPWKYK